MPVNTLPNKKFIFLLLILLKEYYFGDKSCKNFIIDIPHTLSVFTLFNV